MNHYEHCPICGSASITSVLKAKDYTVSGEIFNIWACKDCTGRFTQDVPAMEAIAPYYQSETYISHTETKAGFINRLYHQARNITLKGKCNLIRKETGLTTGQLLDVGAGTGAFLSVMKKAGWEVSGIEPDEQARKNANRIHDISPLPADAFFTLQPESFDAISMWHVLEHVHQLHEYIAHLKKILKKDGVLFIAVPNHTSSDAQHYDSFWAAYDVPRHLYHFSPLSMKQLMLKHGLEITRMAPMWFDSFYVSMLSEKYRSGKNRLIPAFVQGLKTDLATMKQVSSCSSIIYIIRKK
jgi:SAM-dependent methyltransferase